MTAAGELRFHDLIHQELIVPHGCYPTRNAALTALAGMLVESGYCHRSFVPAILEREREHPSGLAMPGGNIAIPHTDADHVIQPALVLARLEPPVPFRAMGDPATELPVTLISLFALHDGTLAGNLLHTLIHVYQDSATLQTLHAARDALEIYTELRKHVDAHQPRR